MPAAGAPEASPPDPTLLQALLHDAGELAAVLDPDGTFGYLTRCGRRILGLRPDGRVPPGSAFDVVAEVDLPVLDVDLRPALGRGGTWSGNLAVVTRSGAELPTRSTLRAWPATADS